MSRRHGRQTDKDRFWDPPSLLFKGYWGSKRPGQEADECPPCSAKVRMSGVIPQPRVHLTNGELHFGTSIVIHCVQKTHTNFMQLRCDSSFRSTRIVVLFAFTLMLVLLKEEWRMGCHGDLRRLTRPSSSPVLVQRRWLLEGQEKGNEPNVRLVFTASRFQGATVTDLAVMDITHKKIALSGSSSVFSCLLLRCLGEAPPGRRDSMQWRNGYRGLTH